MEEEYDNEDSCSEEMRHLEELIAEFPKRTMRCEGEPRLEDQSDNPRPIEEVAHFPLHHHVVESYVIDDEGESVDQGEDEEGVGGPAMEDLESLVGNTCKKRDPIGLGRGGTWFKNLC